ncbi:MAG: 16S rRNA processing protein RimM [Spirochaetales bacterium]|nr:MAG: 16S rRNA processing protein RimM [Spirochaetales bacterium]
MTEKLVTGVITTSHGRDGLVKVKSMSGETGHFHAMKEVVLRREERLKTFKVEKVKDAGSGFVLLKLEGVSSPEEAKKWGGWEILVDRDSATPLGRGEFYIMDLKGCALEKDGVSLGIVEGIYSTFPADLLEVRCRDNRTVLVPFSDQFIGNVDAAGKVIELKQEWILE